MPNLTRNAVKRTNDLFNEYLDSKKTQQFDASETFETAMDQIERNEKMYRERMNDIIEQRDYSYKEAYKNNDIESLNNIEKEYHEKYDEFVALFASDLFKMQDSLDEIIYTDAKKKYLEDNNLKEEEFSEENGIDEAIYDEIKENYIEEFEQIDEAKEICIKFLRIDENKFNEFFNIFKEADEYDSKIEAFKVALDKQDEETKEKENVKESLEKELLEEKLKEEERLKEEKLKEEKIQKEIEDRNKKRLEDTELIENSRNFINKNIGNDLIDESINFLNDKAKSFDKNENFENNLINLYHEYTNTYATQLNKRLLETTDEDFKLGFEAKIEENTADSKKIAIAGYVKIKEHFDNKNIFQKLFSLRESIREWRTMKDLSEIITEKYNISSDTLKDVSTRYIESLKEREIVEPKIENQEVTRSHSNEFDNKLSNSINKNTIETSKENTINEKQIEKDFNK